MNTPRPVLTLSGAPQGIGERAATAGPLARRLAAKSEPTPAKPAWLERLTAKDMTRGAA